MKERDKACKNGYMGVNIVFTKPIHKIMFEIQNKPFFKWPRPMGPTQMPETPSFIAPITKIMDIKSKIAKPLSNS